MPHRVRFVRNGHCILLAKTAQTWAKWLSSFLGIVPGRSHPYIVQQTDKLARYNTRLALSAIVVLLMPMLPGIGQEVLGSRIWIKIEASASSRRNRQGVHRLPGVLPAQNREMLSVFTVRVGPLLA